MYQHGDYVYEVKSRAPGDWINAVNFADGQGPPPARPYQVELHLSDPGGQPCLMRCVDCHGQFHRTTEGTPGEVWLNLLDDLASMDVPSIVYSGAYSDPTMNEALLIETLQKGRERWGVKLHTYGLGLTHAVQQAIAQAARKGPGDSYVTISKTTVNHYVYKQLCRPPKPAEDSLRREEQYLTEFFEIARTLGDKLTVRVNCRLTKINGDPRHVAELLRWLSVVSPVVPIRFTTDYTPTGAPEDYLSKFHRDIYMYSEEAALSVKAAVSSSGFPLERVSFRDAGSTRYYGQQCYNGLLFSAVSADGLAFPCQGIASRHFGALSYGDLKAGERFPAVWERFTDNWHRNRFLECPRCVGACEQQVNASMNYEVGS